MDIGKFGKGDVGFSMEGDNMAEGGIRDAVHGGQADDGFGQLLPT